HTRLSHSERQRQKRPAVAVPHVVVECRIDEVQVPSTLRNRVAIPRERVSGLTLFMLRLRCDVKVAILVVCCLVRATAAAEAAITSIETSQADALAGLNDKLDRLTSKVESLTHRVEDFVDAGRQEGGGPAGPPAARVEVGRGVGQIDNRRGGIVRHVAAESDLNDSSVEGEGEKKQEDRN
ncbi:unnamed protein product, partial [Ectocarpus sp. 12 AP-2014]